MSASTQQIRKTAVKSPGGLGVRKPFAYIDELAAILNSRARRAQKRHGKTPNPEIQVISDSTKRAELLFQKNIGNIRK